MRTVFTLLIASALLGACGTAVRFPQKPEEISLAKPYGIPGILRFWGDDVAEDKLQFIRGERIKQTRVKFAAEIAAGEPVSETVLALSGGGADGAFGAGVLAGWTARGDRPEFDVVTGVSTGAIIALFAFLGPEYDDELKRFYTQYSTDQLLEPSPFAALTGGTALSDTAGYDALVEEAIDEAIVDAIAREAAKGRVLLVGTTNLDFSRPMIWSVTDIAATGHPEAAKLIRDIIRASSAIPALFPPVLIPTVSTDGKQRDELHVDGGATQQVMVFSPKLPISEVDKELGIDIDRTIYLIINNNLEKPYEPVDLGVLSIAGKAVSSLIGGSGTGDLYKIYTVAVRDDIDFRLLWVPKSFEVEAEEAFDLVYMRALYEVGHEIGLNGAPWRDAPPNFTTLKSN